MFFPQGMILGHFCSYSKFAVCCFRQLGYTVGWQLTCSDVISSNAETEVFRFFIRLPSQMVMWNRTVIFYVLTGCEI